MERAISELKGEPVEPEMDPEIVVSISAYIPEGYIFNIDQRLTVYRRLAKVTSNAEIEKIREELLDRFGPLPDEAMALLEKIMLKVLCKKLYIQRLELSPKKMALVFSEMTPVTPERIMRLVTSDPEHFRLKADYILQVEIVDDGRTEAIKTAKKVLQELDS
jgi:transcription-repair coupling factor (superfamily II helicase)